MLGVVTVDVSVATIAAKLLVVPQSKNGRRTPSCSSAGRVLAHPLCMHGQHASTCVGVDISQLESVS